jgi:hypothetical protein
MSYALEYLWAGAEHAAIGVTKVDELYLPYALCLMPVSRSGASGRQSRGGRREQPMAALHKPLQSPVSVCVCVCVCVCVHFIFVAIERARARSMCVSTRDIVCERK